MKYVNFLRSHPAEPVTPVEVTDGERSVVYMAASLLLDYPKADWAERLNQVSQAVTVLPEPISGRFLEFCNWAQSVPQSEVEAQYVDTFDQKRRCAPYLTYYAVGDTRGRGAAILTFQELLKAAGFELQGNELPDYLPVVLELCARSDDPAVKHLLPAYREGLEVLRAALGQLGAPWTPILENVCAVLGPIDDQTMDLYQKLIRQGPPAELVGNEDLPFPTSIPGA
ncbi:nitrate reductase molybdenum cofactor assembly chaperone [Boudabousia liubingyangii]|uniref:nitrate reductase molybdenum cofactor assembly chaperone n=1 Tax=Boudabousia liubingyangii TaxID=1921764 RepID=UPI0009FADA40|nr:nitrate reductase molybdenum cofactor assembly chaperone [Boudabousia liubingyangii]